MKNKELMNIITIEEGKQCVSARELHEKLEVGRAFTNWIKGRIEKYGFIENEDYMLENLACQNGQASWGGNNKVDYIITLDMAKELCMVENNDLGRTFRKYFIECEKKLKNIKATALEMSKVNLNNVLSNLQQTLEDCKSYYKINCATKYQYSEYIKKRLGIARVNKEYEQVKSRLFTILGVQKWEDISHYDKSNIVSLIDESIKVIKSERKYEQTIMDI